MSATERPLVWDFWREVEGAAGLGTAVEYYDESTQSLYLASGLRTRIAQIEEGHWSEAVPGPEIVISAAAYTATAWDHPLTGQLYGAAIIGGNLTFQRYIYARELSQLLKTGTLKTRNDSQVAQMSLRLINAGEGFFVGPASLFAPGARMTAAVAMGNSAPYALGEAFVDEFSFDRSSADVSISGRNSVGYRLSNQTFDNDTTFVGTGKQAAEWILGLAGITKFHVGPSAETQTWIFEPSDTLYKGLQDLFAFYPGWALIELPDGTICIGYPAFLAQWQTNSVYQFNGNTEVTKRKSKRSADAAYAKVRVTGKDADGNALSPVLLQVPAFSRWALGARRTKHVQAPDGLTQAELQAYAEQLRDELQYIGVNETFDGPMRPWLLVGDVASVTYDGIESEDLGLINSITHTFGGSGFFTSFAIDSGGVSTPASRSGVAYVTRSAAVNGYNRTQDLADLIGVIGKGKDGKDGKKGDTGATGSTGPQGPAGPNLVSSSTATALNGILKGNGSTVDVAVAGTDYVVPNQLPDAVVANPTLAGTESYLTGLQVGSTKYKVPSGGGGSVSPYTQDPAMDGTASPGSSNDFARGDHVHPSDTAKADRTDLASIQVTGSTNTTGSIITRGTYFYLNGSPVRATEDIAANATITVGTNCAYLIGGGLNDSATFHSFYMNSYSTYRLLFNSYTFAARIFGKNGSTASLDIVYSNGRAGISNGGTLTAVLDNTSGSPTRYLALDISNAGAGCHLGVLAPPGVIESFERTGPTS